MAAIVMVLCIVLSAAALSEEKVNISFMSHTFGPWNEALTDQVAQYMGDNPNVTIDYIIVPGEDLFTRLAVMLEAGTGSDITGVYYPTIVNLVANGRLDIAPDYIVEDIEATCLPFAIDTTKVEGNTYGYVQHVGIYSPVVNTKLWEGDFPDTWKGWVEEAAARNVGEGDSISQAGAVWNYSSIDLIIGWSSLLWAYGGDILTEDLTQAAFNTPEGIEATRDYASMCHPMLGEQAFETEMAMSTQVGPFSKSSFEQLNPNLEFKALPTLKGVDGEPVVNAYSWMWCVNADSGETEKAASWAFLQWLSAPEQYMDLSNRTGFVPIHTVAAEDPSVLNDPWISQYVDALNYGRKYPEHPNWAEIQEAIYRNLQRCAIGEITAEQAVEDAERDVNAVLGV